MDLQLDGAALTAWLVDTPSVSGDEGPLADAIEAALRPLAHLTVHRDGNAIVARTTLGRPERGLDFVGERALVAADRRGVHEPGGQRRPVELKIHAASLEDRA